VPAPGTSVAPMAAAGMASLGPLLPRAPRGSRRGGFPLERGVETAGCVIDNSAIYFCSLGASRQLSLPELNVVGTAMGGGGGQRRGPGSSPGDPEGPMGWGWAWLAPREGFCCGLGAHAWEHGCGSRRRGSGTAAGRAGRSAGSCAGCAVVSGLVAARNAGTGDSLVPAVLTSGLPAVALGRAGRGVPWHMSQRGGRGCTRMRRGRASCPAPGRPRCRELAHALPLASHQGLSSSERRVLCRCGAVRVLSWQRC